MDLLHEEEEEHQRSSEAQHSSQPQKAHFTGEFVLWHKSAAVQLFVWHLGLRMWSGSEEILSFYDLKNQYPDVSCFSASFDVRWASTIL